MINYCLVLNGNTVFGIWYKRQARCKRFGIKNYKFKVLIKLVVPR